VLSAAAAVGQEAPADVDKALRDRVDLFFRYHVEGGASLRKAMEMVADDTKDDYFASGKPQVLKYEILGIEYAQDFTQARVTVDVSRNVMIVTEVVEMTLPMRTTWKIEDGKWVFYQDHNALRTTPWTDVTTRTSTPDPNSPIAPLPDLSKPNALVDLADNILRPSSVDKQSVTLRWGQASEDQVIFLNGYPGVDLELGGVPEIPGLTIAVEKVTLKAKENGVVQFRYTPPPGFDATLPPPPPFTVRLGIVPFNQVFRIGVSFSK